MKFGIAIFHSDPVIYFQVSYLVNVELSRICRDTIFCLPTLSNIDPEWTLTVNVTTSTGITELTTDESPAIDKRRNYMCFTILLPSQYITTAHEYPLNKYITYFFEALSKLLSKYQIPPSVFVEAQLLAEAEILNNPKYYLGEQEKFTKCIDADEMKEIEKTLALHKKTKKG